ADARCERRPVAVRWSRAVAGGVEVDEVRVDLPQGVGVEPMPLGDAGAVALEHDIGSGGEAMDDVESLGRGRIDADAVLALHDLGAGGFGEADHHADRVAGEWF